MATVNELLEQARNASPEAFENLCGPVALLTRPPAELMQRAALVLQAAATTLGSHKPQLDDLLVMLRGFRTLRVAFFKPACSTQTFSLGRDPACEALVDDPSVSKRHASLLFAENRWFLRDEGSLNGTFINGTGLGAAQVELSSGDAVGLGDAKLVFITTKTLRSQLLSMPPPLNK